MKEPKKQPNLYTCIPEFREKLDKTIAKALEEFMYNSINTEEFIMDMLLVRNSGIDKSKLAFWVDNKEIYFNNLYTALVYMGFWNNLDGFIQGDYIESEYKDEEDTFVLNDGGTTITLAKNGAINICPVKPLEYIKVNLVLTPADRR
jgi:hypothetical protein